MKKLRTVIACALSLTIASSYPFAATARAEAEEIIAPEYIMEDSVVKNYLSFSGKVVNIFENELEIEDGITEKFVYALTEDEEGNQVNFLINSGTYMVTDTEIYVGAEVTGYYDALGIAPLIYPPQYTAAVVSVDLPEELSVAVDIFDENLTSEVYSLKLNVSDETEIIYQNGDKFEEEISELANRRLAVVYSITTRSIPAQTSPVKVVVLNESFFNIAGTGTTAVPFRIDDFSVIGDLASMEIVVNNEIIEAKAPYTNDLNDVMVPLRSVAEALGFEVSWDAETRSIMLGNHISLTLDSTSYIFARMAPIELESAPELVEGVTYVPLLFFREVARIGEVYMFENQIVLNSDASDNDTGESETDAEADVIVLD